MCRAETSASIPLGNCIVRHYIVTRYNSSVTHVHELLPLTPQVFHILVALADRDQHGYSIMQDVLERTGGNMRLSPGTLYGSIKRMLEQGLIVELREKDRPDARNDDERRRYYQLTPFGRKVAKAEAARLSEMVEQARVYGLAPKRS
jgi:DNA-binding PadR family transcriptional regulator